MSAELTKLGKSVRNVPGDVFNLSKASIVAVTLTSMSL